MGRIAGDSPGYTYRLCRMVGPVPVPTKYGHILPSVSTILGETLAKPPSAMAWWGYRIFRDGVVVAVIQDLEGFLAAADDPDTLETFLKERGVSPNMTLESAGDRGSRAHLVLECLAEGWDQPTGEEFRHAFRDWAEALAEDEFRSEGTRYGYAAIDFWDQHIQPYIDSGAILDVLSEVPVESLEDLFSGTFDLALLWADEVEPIDDIPYFEGGWSVEDAKTHKPASGHTKPGKGPGYDTDAAQQRAYRKAVEEMAARPDIFLSPFPPGAKTVGQRTIVLRDRAYRGKTFLEDFREVPYEMFKHLRAVYDIRMQFEKGDEE